MKFADYSSNYSRDYLAGYQPTREPLFPTWSLWMKVRAWMIITMCVLLFADLDFVAQYLAAGPSERMQVGTPEWNQKMKEFVAAKNMESKLAGNQELTMSKAVELQHQMYDLGEDLGLYPCGGSRATRYVYEDCLKIYTCNWHPPNDWSEQDRNKAEQWEPDLKEERVRNIFWGLWGKECKEYNEAHPRINRPPETITGARILVLLYWLVKWYSLMTIPALLIFLLNRRSAGEMVLGQPRRILLACCFGPIGILAISDDAVRARSYNELSSWYQREYCKTRLEKKEKLALWQMVDNPLLKFEEAVGLISGRKFRRPALACLLAWLIGMWLSPVPKNVIRYVAVAFVSSEQNLPEAKVKGGSDPSMLMAIMPTEVEVQYEEVTVVVEEEQAEVSWLYQLAENPRAPPVAVKEQHENSFSTLGCTNSKGLIK